MNRLVNTILEFKTIEEITLYTIHKIIPTESLFTGLM